LYLSGEPFFISALIHSNKGYHSNEVAVGLSELGVRTYIAEPDRGRRNWEGKEAEKEAVYGNRRRIRGERGKRMQRQRGEKIERNFAHHFDTGGMDRLHAHETTRSTPAETGRLSAPLA